MSVEPDQLTPKRTPEDPTRTIEMITGASGAVIGPYRLIRQLGEGGMGVVYHAQQLQPIRRDVALKIIKPGMDTARLTHPVVPGDSETVQTAQKGGCTKVVAPVTR